MDSFMTSFAVIICALCLSLSVILGYAFPKSAEEIIDGITDALKIILFDMPSRLKTKFVSELKEKLKNNKSFMLWLYSDDISAMIEADYSAGQIKLIRHWRKDDYR